MPSLPKLGKRTLLPLLSTLVLLLSIVIGVALVQRQQELRSKAQGNTYYVPGDFTTIQAAANAVGPGDKVYVRNGTYNENVTIGNSGTEGSPITFQNAQGGNSIINGSFSLDNKDYVHIIGFEITGTSSGKDGAIVLGNSNYNLIKDNNIHDTASRTAIYLKNSSYNIISRNSASYGGEGIELNRGCTFNTIEYNHTFMNDKRGSNADGIVAFGAGTQLNIIKYNIIHDNSDDGLDTWNGSYELIVGNVSYHNGYNTDGSVGYDGNGFKLGGSEAGSYGGGNLVINNISYNNREIGFTTNNGPKANTLYNNVAYDNRVYGLVEYNNSGGSTFKNNIGYMNGRTDYSLASDTIAINNLSSTNPLFVNESGADFHLQSGSPAMDNGSTLSIDDIPSVFLNNVPNFFRDEVLYHLSHDRDGRPRPQGAGYDIGAYEYTSGGQPPPPPGSPTPTPKPTSTPSPAPTAAPGCHISKSSWQNFSIAPQTGSFSVEFDATPQSADTSSLTMLSSGPGAAYTDYALLTRFHAGIIDARNGSSYQSQTQINFVPGTTYHFRLTIDVPANSYSVYVTPQGGSEQTIGTNFAFRTEQSGITSLDNWGLRTEAGFHQICNFTVAGSSTPPPTLPGDIDGDNDVDIFDYNILASNFGSTSCGNIADIDGDCDVDIFDYNSLVGNFGK